MGYYRRFIENIIPSIGYVFHLRKKPPLLERQDLPTLTIDWNAYLPLFESEDIPEEQKRELIEALWSIVVSFVDLGFGTDRTTEICGQGPGDVAATLLDVIECWDIPNIDTARARAPSEAPEKRP